ncbi:hypothetical protein Xmau_00918 [Xenorhabdus mauleonii]|uniref:Uncharacterized protein n=1 Tax=Xenorhabdus mauleonii TaxID=351675 RepID=A0A1I3LQA3_9GAMM|nr:contractile injection system tape measure protein [Xenorhabdus mauleonii]PHM45268.1 hypothetical protein Xmau_00918 [Xenorhabdus mauleonii]SFI86897.1 hypothetical protein SAMN05421680_10435 [Xenorhabdus mauleonii]
MASEPNLLSQITIAIETNSQQVAKKILHGSLLNQEYINRFFNAYFDEHGVNLDIHLESLTLDLGEIHLRDFNSLFPVKLKNELNKILLKYKSGFYQKREKQNSEEDKVSNKEFVFVNAEQLCHEKKKNYVPNQEQHITQVISDHTISGAVFSDKVKPVEAEQLIASLSKIKSISNQHEFIKNNPAINNIDKAIKQLDKLENRWVVLLAKNCLIESCLQSILSLKKPELLVAISRQLVERKNESKNNVKNKITSICTSKNKTFKVGISSGELICHALIYLEKHEALEIPEPDNHIISRIVTEINTGLVNKESVLLLFRQAKRMETPLVHWRKKIWQGISPKVKKYFSAREYQEISTNFDASKIDKDIYKTEPDTQNMVFSANSGNSKPDRLHIENKPFSIPLMLPEKQIPHEISNSGILILWPMLPALFNQLGLLEKQNFIHLQAQLSAVTVLDYLIWGNENAQAERNMLNNVLCGLSIEEKTELLPLAPEKQFIIDHWFDAVIAQLPGWKKLSRNDVRHLFLQRKGKLLVNEQGINITIQKQPFDALLTDWLWPLNVAKFPWLNHPLVIDWQYI